MPWGLGYTSHLKMLFLLEPCECLAEYSPLPCRHTVPGSVSRGKGPFLSVGEFQAPCLNLNTSRKPFSTTRLGHL